MNRLHLCAAAIVYALAMSVAAAAPALDEYTGRRDIWSRQTGFFEVEKIRDRWWFITPLGNAFLARGVEGVNPVPGERLEDVRARLTQWGFNAIGPHAPEALRGEGLAYTLLLNLSQPTMAAGATAGRRFPDVFDARFERIANEIAANICSLHAEDPWLLGYFTDEGLEWRADGPADLVDAFFDMPAESAGKRALVAQIRRRYEDDIERFDDAWDVRLGSFDQLLEMPELKPGRRFKGYAVTGDRAALLTLIARRYFEVTTAAIRAHDPNHVVLGCRFAEAPARQVVAAMRGHVDVVSIAGGGSALEALKQMHSDSELPLLVGALALPPARQEGRPADTRREPAAEYQAQIEQLAQQAFVVGYAWPRYAEGVGDPYADFPALLSAGGKPRLSLVRRVEKANDRFRVEAAFARLKPSLFEIVERYELRRAAVAVHADGDLSEWKGAVPMRLRPSVYHEDAADIEAVAYLMWDAGAVHFAGRVHDPSVTASTLTEYVGADWLELVAGSYPFYVTLLPGHQTVTDGKGKSKPAHLVVRRIYAPSEVGDGEDAADDRRQVAGYTFEGQVKAPTIIPEGFVFQFGLALHHYTVGGREVALSYPYYWSPSNPASAADVIVTSSVEP